MKSSIKLFDVFGIAIKIHITFFLLLAFVMTGGTKWVFVVLGVFTFVTIHEICHSLVAKSFKIPVSEITLFPIGGIASMSKMPEKPWQELLISIAGPLSNITIVAIFFYPLKMVLGEDVLLHQLSTATWPLTFAYVYWINLMLAGFNMLPAFPMDGGRILRSLLAMRLGRQKATKIAVSLGHLFAFGFAYFGVIKLNLILVIIAVFIYTAASSEGAQVDIKETLKKIRVRDILPGDFHALTADTTLAKVVELIFHSHQEDFPVVDGGKLIGFATRKDIMSGIHSMGMGAKVGDIMRTTFFKAKESDQLMKVHDMMQASGARALPVVKDDKILGVVTLEDIGRVYAIISKR